MSFAHYHVIEGGAVRVVFDCTALIECFEPERLNEPISVRVDRVADRVGNVQFDALGTCEFENDLVDPTNRGTQLIEFRGFPERGCGETFPVPLDDPGNAAISSSSPIQRGMSSGRDTFIDPLRRNLLGHQGERTNFANRGKS